MKNKVSKYTHRLLARFVIEAQTPLKISSGEKDITTDSLVAVDVNGFPYLPGTSIAGVVRSIIDPNKNNKLFGFQNAREGYGSEIIFSEGHILDSNGKVVDGLRGDMLEDILKDPILDVLKYELPIRQHARMGHKGTTVKSGKFDEQIVIPGTRFCFEIEIVSDSNSIDTLKNILRTIQDNTFRLGGGTRKGFGSIKVVDLETAVLDLKKDMNLYLEKSSRLDLSANWKGWKNEMATKVENDQWTIYTLNLKAKDFLCFGSGYPDPNGDADMTTIKERKIDWSSVPATIIEDQVLIPATSLKGALRHRTIYRFNQIRKRYADDESDLNGITSSLEISQLFGDANESGISRGNIIFNDIIESEAQHILMNHTSIDRFTGGTIDGALFTEQVDYVAGRTFTTQILIKKEGQDEDAIKAFEIALKDITSGLLPIGGGVNRGHGVFTGDITIKEL